MRGASPVVIDHTLPAPSAPDRGGLSDLAPAVRLMIAGVILIGAEHKEADG